VVGVILTHRWRQDQNSYDESEQKGRELTEQVPTTLSAFKTHPLYCLERFVHKYEALYPRGPVLGEFKGQPIYPRSCVRKVGHTTPHHTTRTECMTRTT
jgi:hypothetical protein